VRNGRHDPFLTFLNVRDLTSESRLYLIPVAEVSRGCDTQEVGRYFVRKSEINLLCHPHCDTIKSVCG